MPLMLMLLEATLSPMELVPTVINVLPAPLAAVMTKALKVAALMPRPSLLYPFPQPKLEPTS